jgi:hypothetical protein
MKTKIVLAFLLFLPTSLLLVGCESSSVEPISTKTDLLTGTIWRVSRALALGPGPGQTTDVTYQFPYLSMIFTKDGKYTTPVHNGTWQFINFETGILFDKDSVSQITANVVELTAVSFRIVIPTVTAYISAPVDLSFAAQSASMAPEANFEALWQGYDANYSFFELKKINWDSLHSVYRPQVTSTTNDVQLLQIMSSMLSILKDGHVNLLTPIGNYFYSGWWTPYPTNFLGVNGVARYLAVDYGYSVASLMRYGKTADSIGYIYIGSFSGGNASQWTSAIDVIVDSLKNTRGIIFDLRNNGGGSDSYASILASRFANALHVFSYVKWRNGPKHSDFTDYQSLTIQPGGPRQYAKRLTVLTNRRCFSSAEEAILMMKSLPQVTTIGDTSGGGSGNPLINQLPNGWTYWVPHWIEYTADKKAYEGTGLPPDIPIWISRADSIAGRDAILERAIQYLR